MHFVCDGSITIMWSLNVFITDFTYLAGEFKKHFFQVGLIKVRPVIGVAREGQQSHAPQIFRLCSHFVL